MGETVWATQACTIPNVTKAGTTPMENPVSMHNVN